MQTQDALNVLVALEERVARIYFRFFQRFRADAAVAACWWDMARDEYGHVGILKMVRELVPPGEEVGEAGTRLWGLVDVVERCEQEAAQPITLERALELAILLESSELDVLGHRIVQSLREELPAGAAQPFGAVDAHCQRLAVAAERVADHRTRQRLETMLAGGKNR